MRKSIVILFIILCISLLAQELNELSIIVKAIKTNDIVSSSIKDVNNRKASCIVFLTDLEVDMDFKPNIELVKLISNSGRHEVYVQPGERVIEVLASGFKPFNLVLSSYGISKLESGDVYQLEITGDKINNLIPVNFIIEPSGAEIFVDGISKGMVDNIQIPVGKHTFKIVKEGYQTIEKEENVTINNTLLRFELSEQMYVAVTIKTTPKGATIYLDDTKATITPKPFFYPDGNYTIRIEKENYETIEESITISSPQTNKNFTLEDIRASLTIKTHSNATVYINDKSYKGGVSDLKLSPQIMQVRVEMPKAETITKNIVLKKKDSIIEELFPEVETGKVIVNAIPVDAEIILTGDGGEKYTSKKPTTFTDVPIGKYELTIKAKGYITHTESFKVKADETVRKQIVLEEGSDKIDKITKSNSQKNYSKSNTIETQELNKKGFLLDFGLSNNSIIYSNYANYNMKAFYSDFHFYAKNSYTIPKYLNINWNANIYPMKLKDGEFQLFKSNEPLFYSDKLSLEFFPDRFFTLDVGYQLEEDFNHFVINEELTSAHLRFGKNDNVILGIGAKPEKVYSDKLFDGFFSDYFNFPDEYFFENGLYTSLNIKSKLVKIYVSYNFFENEEEYGEYNYYCWEEQLIHFIPTITTKINDININLSIGYCYKDGYNETYNSNNEYIYRGFCYNLKVNNYIVNNQLKLNGEILYTPSNVEKDKHFSLNHNYNNGLSIFGLADFGKETQPDIYRSRSSYWHNINNLGLFQLIAKGNYQLNEKMEFYGIMGYLSATDKIFDKPFIAWETDISLQYHISDKLNWNVKVAFALPGEIYYLDGEALFKLFSKLEYKF